MIKARAAVLISGRGSNMMALVKAARAADFPAQIVCVLSSRADAPGLEFAETNNIATKVIDHRAFATRLAFDAALDHYLKSQAIDIAACAGFMRILSPWFIASWKGRVLNIHPSLLPAYKGLHTHQRALADGARTHGCTVHIVTAGLDDGPIVQQAEVPVLANDTPASLAARVLIAEHRIYPLALAKVARELQAKTST